MNGFSKIAVVGCGLIGSSVLRAARAAYPQVTLIAVEADKVARDYVENQCLADAISADMVAVSEADLVVLAVPIPVLKSVVTNMQLKPGAVVTDVASVKCLDLPLPPDVIFIPAHPIAGSEKNGPEAGNAKLFQDKKVILTPENPEGDRVADVAAFWKALGAQIVFMPPDMHDRVYAAVSHLPQRLAFAVKEVMKAPLPELPFYRLCHSDRALWDGIFDANKYNINNVLNLYLEALHQVLRELQQEEFVTPLDGGVRTPQHARGDHDVFPYIAASCLVSAVAREERVVGFSFKPFVGSGFSDFTAPLADDPQVIMERVSGEPAIIAGLLERFVAQLVKDV